MGDALPLSADALCGCIGYLESLKIAEELLRQQNIVSEDVHLQLGELGLLHSSIYKQTAQIVWYWIVQPSQTLRSLKIGKSEICPENNV
jgi:hypothetical protein